MENICYTQWLLLLLLQYMQVPRLNFKKKWTPIWVNYKDGTILCYLLLLEETGTARHILLPVTISFTFALSEKS